MVKVNVRLFEVDAQRKGRVEKRWGGIQTKDFRFLGGYVTARPLGRYVYK